MNLFIRADADGKIGTGHIMRCIALAQQWKDNYGEITFISCCKINAIRERIIKEGFKFVAIENSHPHPDDLAQTLEHVTRASSSWVVLDGYHFTPEYHKAVQSTGIHILVIDDMNHLSNYHADIILNQNIVSQGFAYRCDKNTTLLMGTRYALLRKEFLEYRNFKRHISERVRNILVILGGADPDNVTLKVIEALRHIDDRKIDIRIVIGPANSHREALSHSLSVGKSEVRVLMDPPNMPELMAWADMAISAGGSTCLELAFMGLPSLIVILAENQMVLVDHMVGQHAAVNLGWHNRIDREQLCQKIRLFIDDEVMRETISQNASSLIDGCGALRVVKIMTGRIVTLRQATPDDCGLIWNWSNADETRRASYSTEPISWEEHLSWFREKLADPKHVFLVASDDRGLPIGQIRYAVAGNIATVSVSLDPKVRNLGYGSEILKLAAIKLFEETEVSEIAAYVKAENSVSSKAFRKAGFILAEELYVEGIKSQKYILRKQ